ncbi:MAG: CoA-binding protein [Bacteroidota bacterium]
MKNTLVLGASENPSRYSYMATSRLNGYGHKVFAVGLKEGKIGQTAIHKEFPSDESIDTVTLYMNPTNQEQYIDRILALNPKRIIFNPGTENPKLESLAAQHGIEAVEGCTLVMLASGEY